MVKSLPVDVLLMPLNILQFQSTLEGNCLVVLHSTAAFVTSSQDKLHVVGSHFALSFPSTWCSH